MTEGVQSPATWQELLEEIVQQMDNQQKHDLYERVGVNRVTVRRWCRSNNKPDARHATKLLDNVPYEYRDRLLALMREDPRTRKLFPASAIDAAPRTLGPDQIPQRVYEIAHKAARDTPDRFWVLCETILMEMKDQLETRPIQTGLKVVVARCMPPREDGFIHSLRTHVALGSGPWRADLHFEERFLGIESLAGYAAMQRHGVMVPDLEDTTIVLPTSVSENERSSVAWPIMREGHIAGVLLVVSVQSNYFTSKMLSLIDNYADLIRMAFYDHEFYPFSSVNLSLMPSLCMQRSSFASFRHRVNEEHRKALKEGQSLSVLTHVEPRVRQMIEGELLQQGSVSEEAVKVQ